VPPSVEAIEPQDALQVARLHKDALREGFLSSLGGEFLGLIYASMASSQYAFCFVAREEDRIVGFAAGATRLSAFYREFARRHGLRGAGMLAPKLLTSTIVFKLVETLVYPLRWRSAFPQAEILSVAVAQDRRGTDVAARLFARLMQEFEQRQVRHIHVVVGADRLAARRFYEKMGGRPMARLQVHRGQASVSYAWGA